MTKKTMIVTGASGGMGLVCAQEALALGYNLILVDLHTQGMEQFAQENRHHAEIICYALDVTSSQSVVEFAQSITQHGAIDALIHTVGVSPNMTSWQRIIDIDLIATAKFLEAVRPHLAKHAAAVCISSSSGYMVPENKAIEAILADPLAEDLFHRLEQLPGKPLENTGLAYSYAKKALRFYVANAAKAWGSETKRLVSISPGLINTDAGKKEFEASENFEQMIASIPLARLGVPDEIVHTALFLVSEKASYISGCDILVDGGMIAGMGKAV